MLEIGVILLDFSNIDVDILISELDGRRTAQNLSYQNIADKCNVSQTTIIRTFKRQTEPTMAMLQKIAIAVNYTPKREEIILTGYTQEAYIQYLQKSLEYEKEEQAVRIAQQEAHYNMLLNQKNRTIAYLSGILFLFAVAFIAWLIIDVTHPEVGWFQREVAYRSNDISFSLSALVKHIFSL